MNIQAIADRAAATAFKLAGKQAQGGALKPCTIYAEPATAYDIPTDITTPNFAKTKNTDGLFFDSEEKKKDATPETRQIACLVQGTEVAGMELNHETEVEALGRRWKVWQVTADPVSAAPILHLFA